MSLGSIWNDFRVSVAPGESLGYAGVCLGCRQPLGVARWGPGCALGVLGRPLGGVHGAYLGRPCAHRGGPVSVQSAVLGAPGRSPGGPRGEKTAVAAAACVFSKCSFFAPWGALGASWGVFWASWGGFGASWRVLGAPLERLGAPWRAFGARRSLPNPAEPTHLVSPQVGKSMYR